MADERPAYVVDSFLNYGEQNVLIPFEGFKNCIDPFFRNRDDVWKILISTDNHLGYGERDPVRRDDSFETFEEVLLAAQERNVDFVLLGGDLFHENMPSRYTLHKTMEILKKYSFGADKKHKFEILSEQSNHFSRWPYANIDDQNVRIKLPIFSIHGNHDDPGEGSLAALDLLHVNSLVNYFGKTPLGDQIEVRPLIMQKGISKLALYGLGNIKDERLYRLFAAKNVKFMAEDGDLLKARQSSTLDMSISQEGSIAHTDGQIMVKKEENGQTKSGSKWLKTDHSQRSEDASQALHTPHNSQNLAPNSQNQHPADEEHTPSARRGKSNLLAESKEINALDRTVSHMGQEVFNMLVLHQNRVNRLSKNTIPEHAVSDFDFVVWGHEHESIVLHNAYSPDTAYITQPGSSVATSLVEGESVSKHCVLLEVHRGNFQITPIPLKTVRPFVIRNVDLSKSGVPNNLPEADTNERVSNYLANIVEEILFEIGEETCVDGSKPAAYGNTKVPLVRLRVHYAGYNVINSNRFGQRFVNRVANPGELLIFKRKVIAPANNNNNNNAAAARSAASRAEAEALLDSAPEHSNIEEMLNSYLNKELDSALSFYLPNVLTTALHNRVQKGDKDILAGAFRSHLDKVRAHVLTQPFVPAPIVVDNIIQSFNKQEKDKEIEAHLAAQQSMMDSTPIKKSSSTSLRLLSPPVKTETNNNMNTNGDMDNSYDMAIDGARSSLLDDDFGSENKGEYQFEPTDWGSGLNASVRSSQDNTPSGTPVNKKRPRPEGGAAKRTPKAAGAKKLGAKRASAKKSSKATTSVTPTGTFGSPIGTPTGLVSPSSSQRPSFSAIPPFTSPTIKPDVASYTPNLDLELDPITISDEDDDWSTPSAKRAKHAETQILNSQLDFTENGDNSSSQITPPPITLSNTPNTSNITPSMDLDTSIGLETPLPTQKPGRGKRAGTPASQRRTPSPAAKAKKGISPSQKPSTQVKSGYAAVVNLDESDEETDPGDVLPVPSVTSGWTRK